MEKEIVEYNGFRFIRYPNSERESDSKYFKGWVKENGKWRKESLHRYMWLCERGEISQGYCVHHIDGDYNHNSIDNFTLMLASEHEKLHTDNYTEHQWKKIKEGLDNNRDKATEWHKSDAGREWHSKNAKRQMEHRKYREYVCQVCGKVYTSRSIELRNFVLTIAKANGVDYREWTMKNVFVQFVGLNLLSINILRRSFVHGNVLLRIGGIADLYDISTVSHRFFANGVLVHNCDTFRYVVVDLCSEQYIEFSNRRKRNLYACNGTINFFNPDTECKYTKKILYVMPNVNGKFVLIQAFRCGNKWHVVDVVFMDTTSTEDIRSSILSHESDSCVIECTDAYFPFIRELRSSTSKEIRVMKEFPDVDKRIAATSDYVKIVFFFCIKNRI